MKRTTLRAAALLFALVFAAALVGCRSDSEVERTKLPSIDGMPHKMEKSK